MFKKIIKRNQFIKKSLHSFTFALLKKEASNISIQKILFTLAFFAFLDSQLHAQGTYETGVIVTFAASKTYKNNVGIGFSTETRPVLSEGNFKDEKENGFRMELHQFALDVSKTINKRHKLGYTFILRFRENTGHYRNSFKYTHSTSLNKVKLSNRLVADQTYTNQDFPNFRFRYRIGMTVPFKRDKIESNTFYAKITHEYLSIYEAGYQLEIRLTPALGYQISEKAKFEIGLESRIGNFIQNKNFETDFWINTGLYIKL